ncbi:TetR/AcrR family transcriptional regulator [Nocardia harenae]|uniref:TetR/AcrR family transcriptional regulator n=1 Tax=Nocardia harenae TaxID=358707 RepID=UPI000B2539B4|nr:TetR/AcrR family transcriptional regulator [Nocardia harenae]
MSASIQNAVTRADPDTVEARILDAALTRFHAVGVKKTTIEDVAREAGVDRVTVYRRMGSRDDLVQAVVSREVGTVLAEIADIAERHDVVDDLVVDIFVTVIGRWRTNPLAQRMLSLEPERVVLKLTSEGATTFAMSIAATAAAMQRAADRGLLTSPDDLVTRAEIVCRIVHSLILAPHGSRELSTEAELEEFARRYLVPIITG